MPFSLLIQLFILVGKALISKNSNQWLSSFAAIVTCIDSINEVDFVNHSFGNMLRTFIFGMFITFFSLFSLLQSLPKPSYRLLLFDKDKIDYYVQCSGVGNISSIFRAIHKSNPHELWLREHVLYELLAKCKTQLCYYMNKDNKFIRAIQSES